MLNVCNAQSIQWNECTKLFLARVAVLLLQCCFGCYCSCAALQWLSRHFALLCFGCCCCRYSLVGSLSLILCNCPHPIRLLALTAYVWILRMYLFASTSCFTVSQSIVLPHSHLCYLLVFVLGDDCVSADSLFSEAEARPAEYGIHLEM
jgi:hypothetical protein